MRLKFSIKKMTFIYCFFLSLSAMSEPKNDSKTIHEIQSLKPQLEKADVSSILLKTGQTIAAARLSLLNENKLDFADQNLNIEFYLKDKDSNKWIYLDHVQIDNATFEFRKDGVIKISIQEGGTSHSSTTSLWRFEKNNLRIIGQDSIVYENWAKNENSKITPYKRITSINFLTGRKTTVSEFAQSKPKKSICRFNYKIFLKQKISELTVDGVKEPDCSI